MAKKKKPAASASAGDTATASTSSDASSAGAAKPEKNAVTDFIRRNGRTETEVVRFRDLEQLVREGSLAADA